MIMKYTIERGSIGIEMKPVMNVMNWLVWEMMKRQLETRMVRKLFMMRKMKLLT